jgi:hypothetical protein
MKEEMNTKAVLRLLKQLPKNFTENSSLQNEVFGPLSLVVICEDESDLRSALRSLHGQLTATIIGTPFDLKRFQSCVDLLIARVGRIIYNGVPTVLKFLTP